MRHGRRCWISFSSPLLLSRLAMREEGRGLRPSARSKEGRRGPAVGCGVGWGGVGESGEVEDERAAPLFKDRAIQFNISEERVHNFRGPRVNKFGGTDPGAIQLIGQAEPPPDSRSQPSIRFLSCPDPTDGRQVTSSLEAG